MEKKFKVEEISSLLMEAKPKYVCLEDSEGRRIIPFNTKDSPFKEHLIKICSRLKAKILNDGTYFVCYGESSAKGGAVTKIPYVKGEIPNPTLAAGAPVTIIDRNEKPMSQEQIIELIKENANLKADNEVLRLQHKQDSESIAALEDEIAELDNGPKPGIFGMSEGLQNKLGDLAAVLVQKWTAPPPPPISEPQTPQKLTYEQILGLLQNNPELLSQLRKDLNPQPQQNGYGN